MPAYLLTFHAYRSWMPGRKQGYVRRNEGIVPSDPDVARQYADKASDAPVTFNASTQKTCIDAAVESCEHQACTWHCVATDASHVHVLLSWSGDRPVATVRAGLKQTMTRRLNASQRRNWFSKNASRKRVRDRAHFDYLISRYLPSHRGLKWNEDQHFFQ